MFAAIKNDILALCWYYVRDILYLKSLLSLCVCTICFIFCKWQSWQPSCAAPRISYCCSRRISSIITCSCDSLPGYITWQGRLPCVAYLPLDFHLLQAEWPHSKPPVRCFGIEIRPTKGISCLFLCLYDIWAPRIDPCMAEYLWLTSRSRHITYCSILSAIIQMFARLKSEEINLPGTLQTGESLLLPGGQDQLAALTRESEMDSFWPLPGYYWDQQSPPGREVQQLQASRATDLAVKLGSNSAPFFPPLSTLPLHYD